MEEQGRNNLHAHIIVTLAGFPSSLSDFLDQLKAHPTVTVDNIVRFAENLESHNPFFDAHMQSASMRCCNEACQQAGASEFISEPIPDYIKNATKPLGFNFEEPATVRCETCEATYSGSKEIERAALAELAKHADMKPLVDAWRRDDKASVRELAAMPEVVLDMDMLRTPKCQAVLALLVLQGNRHRAGHHASCFKVKGSKTCRYRFPRDCINNQLTTLVINGVKLVDSRNEVDVNGDMAMADGEEVRYEPKPNITLKPKY